jgi:hypothetical protein
MNFSKENKNSIIFEATRKMKKYVLTAIPKPRTRQTEVGSFEKVELVKHRTIIDMGIASTTRSNTRIPVASS